MTDERTGGSAPMAPFDLWTQWLRSSLGEVTAPPGASVPWLMSPGVSTREEADQLPSGASSQGPSTPPTPTWP